MDKEEFLKSKLQKIAYNYGIRIDSPIVVKEIMTELEDIYNEGFNEGYSRDWYITIFL